MDARYLEPPVHHHFRPPDQPSPISALASALEAARGFAEALAVEIQLGERHREHGYVEERYDIDPLAILIATPGARRHGPIEPVYRDTETWVRPAIERSVLDQVAEHIAQIESDDPECERHWVRAAAEPMCVRLPEPGQLAGRELFLADDDGAWERIAIEWRDGEAWLAGGSPWRDALWLELDARTNELDVVVGLTTWQPGGPGRGDLEAFFARLVARGFSAA